MPPPRDTNLEFNFGPPGPDPVVSAAGFRAVESEGLNPPGEAVGEAEPVPPPEILTVSQLTRRIRRLLEAEVGTVWVEGEISNLRRQSSGHSYFSLKDADSQLACVLFKGNVHAGMPKLDDGLRVQALGEISVFEPQGKYQLIVRELQAAGQGLLQMRYEALKRKLAAEGLFDAARKKPLPPFPQCLAVITSPTGAALRDMLNILGRRAPWVRVIVYPVRVQGAGAHIEIVTALDALNEADGSRFQRPDLIVLARGGGSIEDLWNFNEESLARAIASSAIPVVSAIGHEIDFTIADFVSDLRAPTPSAAAELIVPDGAGLRRRLDDLATGISGRVQRALTHALDMLDLLSRGGLVREPRRALAEHAQHTDLLATDLDAIVSTALREGSMTVEGWRARLIACRPERALDRHRQSLTVASSRLHTAVRSHLSATIEHWKRLSALVQSLGPESVFARGFSYTTGPDGRAVTNASQLEPGSRITTRFQHGRAESEVRSVADDTTNA